MDRPRLQDLCRRLTDRLTGQPGFDELSSIEPLSIFGALPAGIPVPDGVAKLLIRNRAGRPLAVALCASPVSPGLVARGMDRARAAKAALGPQLGCVILDPMHEGDLEGLSCAVLPYRRPLSANPLGRLWQRRWLRSSALRWLREANRATRVEPTESDWDVAFGEPLRHLASNSEFPEDMRRAATFAHDRLLGGFWRPCHVLAHNDFWEGNLLLNDKSRSSESDVVSREKFFVIDWPGSNVRGYAIYDLVRFARATNLSGRRLFVEIESHCAIVGCEPSDAVSHLLAALGHLGMNLDRFPMEAYLRMAVGCRDTLRSALPDVTVPRGIASWKASPSDVAPKSFVVGGTSAGRVQP